MKGADEMKDIFDKVTQNVKDISSSIAGQTKTTVTQGKTELELLNAKKDLKKLYAQLGEKVYQNRLYPEADPGIEVLYSKIVSQVAHIRELERKAEYIKREQKNTMESIKRSVKKTWKKEGEESKTPKADKDGYPQMKFCQACNIGNHPEAEYCIACGLKLIHEEE